MKRLLLVVSLLILCAVPTQADEELVKTTIMFEYTGTAEQIDEIIKVFLVDMETAIIVQVEGYDFVAYCEDYEHCIIAPGSIQIVVPDEPKLSI